MCKKVKAINNPNNVCFKCLKRFNDSQLHKIKIPALGYGSRFDGFSTEIHLCDECIKGTEEWWQLEEVDMGEYSQKYKYEDEIFKFVKTFPLEGQELFYNRYASGFYMDAQDWIDYELGLLPHEKCKEYGLYSPEEIRAYKDRFPICKHVYIEIYEDGGGLSRCPYNALGNGKGEADKDNISSECYKCPYFELREGEILVIDKKLKKLKEEYEMQENFLKLCERQMEIEKGIKGWSNMSEEFKERERKRVLKQIDELYKQLTNSTTKIK